MTSVKNIARRFLSLSLSVLMVFLLIPATAVTVSAAEISGLSDTGIILTTDGDAVCNASGNSITCSVTGNGDCGRSKTGSMTIKNGKAAEAVLKFDYEVTLNGGLVSVDGAAISSDISGSYEKALAADDSITVSIQSPANGNTSTVTLTNISMLADVDANVTFLPAENGSYTVDGTAVTEAITLTKNSSETFALAATPADGYKFLGWKSQTGGTYVSYSADVMLGFDSDVTIVPVFTAASNPVFSVDGAAFTDLNEAGAYAVENGKSLIVLVQDGTLPAGNYSLPSGTVLLIPFDERNTLYLDTIEAFHEAHTAQSPYKTLTLADGANITIENGAAVSVGSRICAHGTNTNSWNGTPTGKYGLITMADGSHINVNDGGTLYTYGYINGCGTIDVNAGGNVYELFQIRNWRGGSATTDAGFTEKGVFPMSQYYVQNIEVPLTIEPGAKEYAVAAINAQNMAVSATASFIGDDGMFVQSGTITKRYDSETDRLIFDVEGDLSISPLALEAGGMNINTKYFALPINNNITINVVSGATTLSQDVALLPGSVINIGANADVNIASGSKVYVYDKDEWGKYGAAGAEIVPVGYSTANGAAVVRRAADLNDAKMNVNGTITVNGELYTTAGGADITSSEGTGKITYHSVAGTQTETYQCLQSNTTVTPVAIPITPAQLHNGNTAAPFTETDDTVAEDYYTYSTRKDMWLKGDDIYYHIVWKNDDGTILKEEDVDAGVVPAYTGETPSKADDVLYTYTFTGWSAEPVAATEDATYTAVYDQKHKDGWAVIDGNAYYYIDNQYVTGVAQAEYPSSDIGEYGPSESDLMYHEEEYKAAGYETKSYFLFDENGVFQKDYTGMLEVDGETRWVANGELSWHGCLVTDGTDYSYVSAGGSLHQEGTYWIGDTNGLLEKGYYTFKDYKIVMYEGFTELDGKLYYYEHGRRDAKKGLFTIDGDYYYIKSSLEVARDCEYYVSNTNGLMDAGVYHFAQDGKLIQETVKKNGLYEENGQLVYYVDDVRTHAGLIKVDGYYYYIKSNGTAVIGCRYYVSDTNGLMERSYRDFDSSGRMIIKNGLVEENGQLVYYVDGVKAHPGLVQIDGDYYYIKSNCTAVRGCSYYVSNTNGYVAKDTYTFDADGKLVIPEVKNGLVAENGKLFYYEDGVNKHAGLIEIDGDYYYICTSGFAIQNRDYYISNTNGLLEKGTYHFDADGKLVH